MPRISRTCLTVALLVSCSLPLAGCGGNGAKPKGQILKDGAAYTLADGEHMSITFSSTAGKGSAAADVTKDGSFAVGGDGLAPGPYTVNITYTSGGNYVDKFNGEFNGPNNPLKVEIPAGAAPVLEIDVGKKTVTVK